MQCLFVFQPGCYEAEGVIELSLLNDLLPFVMKWHVFHPDPLRGEIECCQEIRIKGFSEILYNQYTFSEIKESSFNVIFENINLDTIKGKGVADSQFIGWEFRNLAIDYEGYEYYHRKGDHEYELRAAYTASDGLRTEIRGNMSRKPVENLI
jgi:hypothetical protein